MPPAAAAAAGATAALDDVVPAPSGAVVPAEGEVAGAPVADPFPAVQQPEETTSAPAPLAAAAVSVAPPAPAIAATGANVSRAQPLDSLLARLQRPDERAGAAATVGWPECRARACACEMPCARECCAELCRVVQSCAELCRVVQSCAELCRVVQGCSSVPCSPPCCVQRARSSSTMAALAGAADELDEVWAESEASPVMTAPLPAPRSVQRNATRAEVSVVRSGVGVVWLGLNCVRVGTSLVTVSPCVEAALRSLAGRQCISWLDRLPASGECCSRKSTHRQTRTQSHTVRARPRTHTRAPQHTHSSYP